MNNKTIGIVGVGNVGSTLAFNLAISGLCKTILLKDIREDFTKAMALDISHSAKASNYNTQVKACFSKDEFKDCDIIIITAGVARKPNMSREDLLLTNAKIIETIFDDIFEQNKEAIYIIVSNPLDAMVYVASKKSNLPRNRVFGMAGILDTARFKHYIEEKINYEYKNIEAMVIGSHSNNMLPLINHAKVDGKAIKDILNQNDIDEILENTKNAGARVVELLKTGSAYFAPAYSCFLMCKAILEDSKEVFVSSILLLDEYGYKDLAFGVPAIFGKNGVEKIIELNLDENEKKELDIGVNLIKNNIKILKELIID